MNDLLLEMIVLVFFRFRSLISIISLFKSLPKHHQIQKKDKKNRFYLKRKKEKQPSVRKNQSPASLVLVAPIFLPEAKIVTQFNNPLGKYLRKN